MKPLIGITADIDDGARFSERYAGKKIVHLWERYPQAIRDAGGAVALLVPSENLDEINIILNKLDGLLISGGAFDIPPEDYGEELISEKVKTKPGRSRFERELILKAIKAGIAILGICGGEQAINVALGGTLYQDLPFQKPSCLTHEQRGENIQVAHPVEIDRDSILAQLLFGKKKRNAKSIWVNSTHHQSVKHLGKGLRISAFAPDQVIEAIELERGFVVGVQWHPELLYTTYPEQYRLLKGFVRFAKSGKI